jgi:hypothetical protein
MAATKTRSGQSASRNGNAASSAGAKVKGAGGAVASTARRVRVPALAAGATAVGLAGGMALGSRMASKRRGLGALLAPRPRVFGVPIGAKSGLARTAEVVGTAAKGLSSVTSQLSDTRDEARQIREQLEMTNKRSPIEVVLDGLTHRRGGHRLEK